MRHGAGRWGRPPGGFQGAADAARVLGAPSAPFFTAQGGLEQGVVVKGVC